MNKNKEKTFLKHLYTAKNQFIETSTQSIDNTELLTWRFLHFLAKEGILNENNK